MSGTDGRHKFINMNLGAYLRLKQAHEEAEGNVSLIEIDGQELDVAFLGYVLEYVEMERPQWLEIYESEKENRK